MHVPIEANKDVTDGNDALGCSVVVDLPSEDSVAIDRINMVSVAGHKTSNGEVAETTDNRSGQEKQTARDFVNIRQDETSGHKENDANQIISIRSCSEGPWWCKTYY